MSSGETERQGNIKMANRYAFVVAFVVVLYQIFVQWRWCCWFGLSLFFTCSQIGLLFRRSSFIRTRIIFRLCCIYKCFAFLHPFPVFTLRPMILLYTIRKDFVHCSHDCHIQTLNRTLMHMHSHCRTHTHTLIGVRICMWLVRV